MATKKLKLEEEAITEILVADTGAEVSDVEEEEDDEQQQEVQLLLLLLQQASA